MLIDQDGNQITAGDHMTGNGDVLAMSTAWRIVAVLNKKVEFGPLLNVLGHLMTGLAGGIPDRTGLDLQQYFDGDGDIHPDISCHPVIVLRADRSNQLRALRARLRDVKYSGSRFRPYHDRGRHSDAARPYAGNSGRGAGVSGHRLHGRSRHSGLVYQDARHGPTK